MIVLKLSQKKKKNHRKNKELFNKHQTIDHFATLYAFEVKVRRELKQNSSTSCCNHNTRINYQTPINQVWNMV
jgi:hypothetical protein